jgi:predicted TIM-barrel fold metal-dependent hydrolase
MDASTVDIVCNLFTEREVALRAGSVDAKFFNQVRIEAKSQKGVPLEDFIEKMDVASIDLAFLAAVKAGSHRLRDSWALPYERVAEVCREHPQRLRGLAGVDPTLGMAGLRELEWGVRELGFVGAHLYPHWFELPPDHAKYYPIYAKCCELEIPIMMQVGQCLRYGSPRVHPSVGRPILLDQVACDFPELLLIGIHIGYPWTEEMISMANKHENVYIGTDAYAPKYWGDALVHFIDSYGQDKVMFGTDFPVIDPVRARREVEELAIRPAAKTKLLGENAKRVFRL